jgi:hypothetical protein
MPVSSRPHLRLKQGMVAPQRCGVSMSVQPANQDLLASKPLSSSAFPQFRPVVSHVEPRQVVFLHHVSSSQHSLSQKTRLIERRVLACGRLILAHLGFADLYAPPASFGRLTPLSPPSDAQNRPSGLSFSPW